MSLEQLFAAGAHRTVEFLAATEGERLSLTRVVGALEARYGPGSVDLPTAQILLGRAERAQTIGRQLQAGLPIDVPSYAVNPALSERYAYTTVNVLPDPDRRGRTVEIPFTVYSDTELTPNEIREAAQAAVLNPQFRRDCVPGALGADLLRRDVNFRRSAEINAPAIELIETLISSVYRRE